MCVFLAKNGLKPVTNIAQQCCRNTTEMPNSSQSIIIDIRVSIDGPNHSKMIIIIERGGTHAASGRTSCMPMHNTCLRICIRSGKLIRKGENHGKSTIDSASLHIEKSQLPGEFPTTQWPYAIKAVLVQQLRALVHQFGDKCNHLGCAKRWLVSFIPRNAKIYDGDSPTIPHYPCEKPYG